MIAINSPLVRPTSVDVESTAALSPAVPPLAAALPDEQVLAVPHFAKAWTGLAVGSLVVAGLLSLSVVIGRLPLISGLIGDPLFFKRCLVVHVDLALLAWFCTFMAALASLRVPHLSAGGGRLAVGAVGIGMVMMLGGAVVPGAMPILSNYIPIIDHPLFLSGLGVFALGILTFAILAVMAPAGRTAGGLPEDAATGVVAASLALALAGTAWVAAKAGLPEGLDRWTRAEFSSWGAGHVLQVANTSAMLAVWLWLVARATGRSVFTLSQARVLFTWLLAPHFVMPLLTWRGSLHPLYLDGATTLMRWGIAPVVLVILVQCVRHLRRHRSEMRDTAARMATAGFAVSASLALLGIALGAAIRGSTTLIPAHYHASLGAVTAAFMAGAFLVVEAVARDRQDAGALDRLWVMARRQIRLFGAGQAVFAIGFGLGGLYGLGRKAYASEQVVRSGGEVAGLVVMGVGGLVAVVGGLWFLLLMIREMRRWRGASGRCFNPIPLNP